MTRKGRPLRLALQPARLLALLIQRHGDLVTREELRSHLWPDDTFGDFDHGLNNAMNRLREALGDSAIAPRYIQTAPQRGYRFIAEVQQNVVAQRGEREENFSPSSRGTPNVLNSIDRPQAPSNSEATDTDIQGRETEVLFAVSATPRKAMKATEPITDHLRAETSRQEQVQASSAFGVEPEAYDCYLRGRFYAQQQNRFDNETAILAFERAVAIDPRFALAYAELAQSYVWKIFLFAPHERQWQEKAFIAVEKALSLDPNLAVAYLARGRLLWTPVNRFPHARAIRDYQRAVALDPNLDEARNQLALIYCHIGYFEEALRESQAAALTNPNSHLSVYRTAQTLAFQGKYEQALAILRTIPRDVNPSLIGYQTAWVLFNLGRSEESARLIDELLQQYPEDDGALFISLQAVLAASASDNSMAETRIEEAIKDGIGYGHFHHSAYHIAIASALMNKPEQAVRWLEFASTDGFPCYPLFETDPNLSALRGVPIFVEFLKRLRQQWTGYSADIQRVHA